MNLSLTRNLEILRAARGGSLTLHAFTPAGLRASENEEPPDASAVSESQRVIMSTAATDRYGDVIAQDGWDLDSFAQNPVLMRAHNYAIDPVGTVSDVSVSDHNGSPALLGTLRFWMNDPSGAGPTVARAYQDGILRGVSVGFRPLEFSPRADLPEDHPHHAPRGFLIQRAELLELSTAPIPVNQEALAIRKAIGALTHNEPAQITRSAVATLGDVLAAPDASPDALDAQIRSVLLELLQDDPDTRRALQRVLRAIQLSRPESRAPTTHPTDPVERIADWLTG